MIRRQIVFALALSALLAGCGRSPTPAPMPDSSVRSTAPVLTIPERQPEPADEAGTSPDTGDRVLSSLTAQAGGGRQFRLDAIGRLEDGDRCGVREVQVYEDGTLVQTVAVTDAPLAAPESGYTSAASVETALAVRDVNFDGLDDLELSDKVSGKDPHHFYLWDGSQYRYAFTLQGVSVNADTREVISTYHDSSIDYTDTYQYNETGTLTLLHRFVQDWKGGTEDFPLVAYYDFPNGVPTLLRQEFTDYNDDGIAMREVRQIVDGQLIPVRMEQLEVIDGELRVVRSEPIAPPEPEPRPEDEYAEGEFAGEYVEEAGEFVG